MEIAERKAIQHCGSDAGLEMAAVYLRIVSTEACQSICMAVPRGLLRGYGDRREEVSFTYESVDHINTKN